VKLLVDEMWPPSIAAQLRKAGYDVGAVTEREELRGAADAVVFAAAQDEDRAIVTEDVADYRRLTLQVIREGRSHAGVIFTLNRTFPRSDPRTRSRLVAALEKLLSTAPPQGNLEWWLSGS
jgi:predicted nuclease of predicted toxin-antitoxin system